MVLAFVLYGKVSSPRKQLETTLLHYFKFFGRASSLKHPIAVCATQLSFIFSFTIFIKLLLF